MCNNVANCNTHCSFAHNIQQQQQQQHARDILRFKFLFARSLSAVDCTMGYLVCEYELFYSRQLFSRTILNNWLIWFAFICALSPLSMLKCYCFFKLYFFFQAISLSLSLSFQMIQTKLFLSLSNIPFRRLMEQFNKHLIAEFYLIFLSLFQFSMFDIWKMKSKHIFKFTSVSSFGNEDVWVAAVLILDLLNLKTFCKQILFGFAWICS